MRKSNIYVMKSILESLNISVTVAHLNDDKKRIQSVIAKNKSEYGVMIFSGAISVGKFNFLHGGYKGWGFECYIS
ncbi:MAG: hypothetical protein ACRCR9_03145 [Chitinophagaceae bacterium]